MTTSEDRTHTHTKPVLLAVDDELAVLGAVKRDLHKRFGGDFCVETAGSGAEALEALRRLKKRGTAVALFLVDQGMPAMSGSEFLVEAEKLYPDARKVLLTAYDDAEAAITSITTIGLDHYVMKPWDSPEEHLYPLCEDLLCDWTSAACATHCCIRVAGSIWSSSSHAVKDFLARNRIPYRWLDIETDPKVRALVAGVTGGFARLPVVLFPDGTVMVEPERRALAEKVGLRTQAAYPFYDLIVVGGGPAGLGAAVYAASEGLHTLIIEKEATGGQAGTSSRIENYVGFPKGLSGRELAQRATAQARRFGAEIVTTHEVTGIRADGFHRFVKLGDGTELGCYALLIASGVAGRRLDVPGIEALIGAGVYYGPALTAGAQYQDDDVLVIGGANSAGQGALFFSRYARKVTILLRAGSIEESMSHYLVQQIAQTANIEVLTGTRLREVKGGERLASVVVCGIDGEDPRELPAAALFVFIGASPRTDFVGSAIKRSADGYILTGPDLLHDRHRLYDYPFGRDPLLLETSLAGVFAAGDVRQGSLKRVAAAIGEGAMSVQLIHKYLKTVSVFSTRSMNRFPVPRELRVESVQG